MGTIRKGQKGQNLGNFLVIEDVTLGIFDFGADLGRDYSSKLKCKEAKAYKMVKIDQGDALNYWPIGRFQEE